MVGDILPDANFYVAAVIGWRYLSLTNYVSDPPIMLTADQAAARLGISVRTLRRRCATGDFPAPANTVKKRPLVWTVDDIDALLRR